MCLSIGEVVGCFLNNPKAPIGNQTNENKQIEVKLFVGKFERLVCTLSHTFKVDSITLPIHNGALHLQHPIITPKAVCSQVISSVSDVLILLSIVIYTTGGELSSVGRFSSTKVSPLAKNIANLTPTYMKNLDDNSKPNSL